MPLLPGKKNIGHNIEEMEAHGHPRDQSIAAALNTARQHREHGGLNLLHIPHVKPKKLKAPHAFAHTKHHTGPIHSSVAGRTDHLPIHVPSGSYVIPADIVSGMGEGNTIAGFKHMRRMFGGMPRGGGEQPYNHEGGPYGMATGGAANRESVSAEDALKYRQLAGAHNINTLTAAFDRAIAAHTALSEYDQKRNAKLADKRVGKFTGTKSGVPDLLQKNAKMMKSEKGFEGSKPVELPDGRGVETTGLALAPAYQEKGFATCSNFKSCAASCLGLTSGGNWMFGGGKDLNALKGPRLAHFKNTMAMLGDPEAFAVKLHHEIKKAKDKAAENGNKLGVRLNVLSDIHPRVHASIIKSHPDVDFYDYTKSAASPIAPNHHYTYSSTGLSQPKGINGVSEDVHNPHTNWTRLRDTKLDKGHNVAMAFNMKGKAGDDKLPEFLHDHETGKKYHVVDGDTHDYRPLDRQSEGKPGVIVGLRNKAQNTSQDSAAKKTNGFFVHYKPNPSKTVEVAHQNPAPVALTNDMKPDISQ